MSERSTRARAIEAVRARGDRAGRGPPARPSWSSCPVTRVEALCDELAARVRGAERGFVLARVAGGYRFQTHPDLAAYVERFVLEGQHAAPVGAGARDARDHRLQAADLPRPDLGDPRRERRGDAAPRCCSAATSRRSGAIRARRPRCSTAPPVVPRAARPRLARRPPAARRLRARRLGGRGARAGAARQRRPARAASRPTPRPRRRADADRRVRLTRSCPSDPTASGCRRSWRAPASARAGRARSSSPRAASPSTARSRCLGRRVDADAARIELDGVAGRRATTTSSTTC